MQFEREREKERQDGRVIKWVTICYFYASILAFSPATPPSLPTYLSPLLCLQCSSEISQYDNERLPKTLTHTHRVVFPSLLRTLHWLTITDRFRIFQVSKENSGAQMSTETGFARCNHSSCSNRPLQYPLQARLQWKWWGTKSTALILSKIQKYMEDNMRLQPSELIKYGGYLPQLQSF